VTVHTEILETEGLFTQGSRPGWTVGESVGGTFEMDRSDGSNGIRYHFLHIRSKTEFKLSILLDISKKLKVELERGGV